MITLVKKMAKIIGDTNSFFKKGEEIHVKKYDDSDDTYLIGKKEENCGIWVDSKIIKF